eukprot:TRINITY_DN14514_c0_g1_i1.p1 TRINITY_DN14514_c0_g1~~TRINITY_DN14514_c0_g1_i1.p1  ORF type:complete len:230 (+),score=15.82 TRINITY_DN14514_c0_g1_i1:387-1076(+)
MLDLRKLFVSVVSGLFGLILITTGKEVYDIGHERLQNATEEVCRVQARESVPCQYLCGGGGIAPQMNCTGHSYVYTATASEKCRNATVKYDERAMFRRKGIPMCRCGRKQPPGDCWTDLPGFAPDRSYQCTVDDPCDVFDFASPSGYEATGVINVFIGSLFVIFSICPETCLIASGHCVANCLNATIPVLAACIDLIRRGLMAWLGGLRRFTAEPARGYLSDDESQPLL